MDALRSRDGRFSRRDRLRPADACPKDIQGGREAAGGGLSARLEGRPQDTIGKPSYEYYKAFNTELAERGFITFSPQNLYIFKDRFRTLQRKANPLKKTLFSIIVPQHQQIVDWLQTLPQVDPERIAFYGLSYGGKTAMRVPPLVTDYCLSICSADFNEWVDKNASTRNPHSYAEPASTRSLSSTWAARSTTPRWRP